MINHRVVFVGTPKIAVSCLKALIDKKINVVGVVTKTDKPFGRKQLLLESDVKQFAHIHKLTIYQPKRIDDIYEQLKILKPDLILVCAYGQIISQRILDLPKYGCVNVHTSLLPRWRGGAPIHYAVIQQDKQTGVTLMRMVAELDAGDILFQSAIPISKKETYKSLYEKLAKLAYKILTKNIANLFTKDLVTKKQDEALVTFARNISREQEKINWSKNAEEVDALIRGLYDKPIAYSTYNNLNVKIHEASLINATKIGTPGEILNINNSGISVLCGDHQPLLIKTLQLPGKKPISIEQMIHGNHPFIIGTKFK